MKRALSLLIPALLLLGQTTGYCQSYLYSGPINAWTEVGLTPFGDSDAGLSISFATINDTLNYNPTSGTLEEIGSVTSAQTRTSFNIEDDFLSPAVSGSATCTVGNNGSFSFDNTYQSEGNGVFFTFLQIPVHGSGIFNGQLFSASWDLAIPMYTQITASSPTSLTFNEFTVQTIGVANAGITGLSDGNSDGTYDFSWNLDPVAMAVTPEPNSLLLLGVGLVAGIFLRRR